MSNCNRLFLTPVSKSNLWCSKCEHVFDPIIKICDCKEPKIVKFEVYLKEKGEVKK